MSKIDDVKLFCIVSDDDGHHYVVPVEHADAASAYFEAVSAYWEIGGRHEYGPPVEPDWLTPVGGCPSRVEFTNWRIA